MGFQGFTSWFLRYAQAKNLVQSKLDYHKDAIVMIDFPNVLWSVIARLKSKGKLPKFGKDPESIPTKEQAYEIVMKEIARTIKAILIRTRPFSKVVICMDGPVPVSKRRMNMCGGLFKKKKYGFPLIKGKYHDSDYILGSEYTLRMRDDLKKDVKKIMLSLMSKSNRPLVLEINGYDVEGEAEIKMFNTVNLKENSRYETIIMVTNDSDAILVGLTQRRNIIMMHTWKFYDLGKLNGNLTQEFGSDSIDHLLDLILLGSLVGNDVLPEPLSFFLKKITHQSNSGYQIKQQEQDAKEEVDGDENENEEGEEEGLEIPSDDEGSYPEMDSEDERLDQEEEDNRKKDCKSPFEERKENVGGEKKNQETIDKFLAEIGLNKDVRPLKAHVFHQRKGQELTEMSNTLAQNQVRGSKSTTKGYSKGEVFPLGDFSDVLYTYQAFLYDGYNTVMTRDGIDWYTLSQFLDYTLYKAKPIPAIKIVKTDHIPLHKQPLKIIISLILSQLKSSHFTQKDFTYYKQVIWLSHYSTMKCDLEKCDLLSEQEFDSHLTTMFLHYLYGLVYLVEYCITLKCPSYTWIYQYFSCPLIKHLAVVIKSLLEIFKPYDLDEKLLQELRSFDEKETNSESKTWKRFKLFICTGINFKYNHYLTPDYQEFYGHVEKHPVYNALLKHYPEDVDLDNFIKLKFWIFIPFINIKMFHEAFEGFERNLKPSQHSIRNALTLLVWREAFRRDPPKIEDTGEPKREDQRRTKEIGYQQKDWHFEHWKQQKGSESKNSAPTTNSGPVSNNSYKQQKISKESELLKTYTPKDAISSSSTGSKIGQDKQGKLSVKSESFIIQEQKIILDAAFQKKKTIAVYQVKEQLNPLQEPKIELQKPIKPKSNTKPKKNVQLRVEYAIKQSS